MIPEIETDECTGCTRCIDVCPPRAIVLTKGKARVEAEFCEECGLCAPECSVGAITIPFPVCGT
jgi:Pyruvate/2-oxoacid:ferredoxin oxidoreductase delta subunit